MVRAFWSVRDDARSDLLCLRDLPAHDRLKEYRQVLYSIFAGRKGESHLRKRTERCAFWDTSNGAELTSVKTFTMQQRSA
jgi:hypothetical protein